MAEKTWNGRFTDKTNRMVESFTASIAFDRRLYPYDIAGSIAHCRMLARQRIIPRRDAAKIVRTLEEIKDELAKFLLSLIQAFLRTGYYTSDHPQSKKAKQGLYDNFQRLLNREYELTFLAYDAPGGKN